MPGRDTMAKREMKSLNVRTSTKELKQYTQQSEKERAAFEAESSKRFSFSKWVRWKLLRKA